MIDEDAAREVVETYRHRAFEWYEADCKTFAASYVDARLGTDFLARLEADLPIYSTPLEAIHIIQRAGGFESIITNYLGDPVPIEQAEFGDVVLGKGPPPFERTKVLGICDEELLIVPAQLGLVWLPMAKHAIKVWKCQQR